jgi:hypothetical protein
MINENFFFFLENIFYFIDILSDLLNAENFISVKSKNILEHCTNNNYNGLI